MKYFFLLVIALWTASCAKNSYPDNHSCSECHAEIYEEYQGSAHAKGYFDDVLHRSIADKISTEKYDCATCHMPMANNLKDIISGKVRPDKNNKTHTDAVSCYFCHTIAYVKKAHRFNVNIKARQAANYKPTLYGRLDRPDHNDQHSSVTNPIYAKKVCTGCHAHKLNENNVTIFRAMQDNQDSESCITCHMPELNGGSDKINKRARLHHASHKFLGIRDKAFRKKGVDITIAAEDNRLTVTLQNKMTHPLIIQSARAKYLRMTLHRAGKTLWKNYKQDPREDKQGYFGYHFKKNGEPIVIPYHATWGEVHNLAVKETRNLIYRIPAVQKGDTIEVAFYVQLAKDDCAKAVNLEGTDLVKPELIKRVSYTIK